MFILSVQNLKGGSNKTTTCAALASSFQLMGLSVCIAEFDENRPLEHWFETNKNSSNNQVKIFHINALDSLFSLIENPEQADIDLLIIDGTTNNDWIFDHINSVSNFVLIVTSPSKQDLFHLPRMYRLMKRKKLTSAFLLTRINEYDSVSDIENFRKMLNDYPYPTLTNTISYSEGYHYSYMTGESIFELPNYKSAQDEINAVAQELGEFWKMNAKDNQIIRSLCIKQS